MKNSLILILAFFSFTVAAQQRQLLKGKVTIGGDTAPGGVFIINNKTGEEAKTNNGGNFSIMARSGDKLAVYSDKTEVREFAINDDTFKESPYTLNVEYKAYELEAVEIDKYEHINSEALGIVPKGQKQYTPAERKLRTAGEFKPIMLLGLLGGGLPLDPIINAMNGRTKMLKGAVATERKEILIEKASAIYTDEQIVSLLNIPQEYVNGFLFYIVEDREFAAALKAGNTDRAKFLMSGLALHYLTTIKK